MTPEENDLLTRVGRGTPMGELLRRYWWPIATCSEIGRTPAGKRLLGEDLVVFRTTAGQVGVVAERCPHRRTSLTIGISEADGIRCGYHGWKFSPEGNCLEQPAEPRLNTRQRIDAYPAQEFGGLVFAYLGPQPAPLLPRFDLFVLEDCLRDIGIARLDFNWLQAMENSVDPHHAEWLHGHFMNATRALEGKETVGHYTRPHARTAFDAFAYGIIKRRMLEGGSEDDDGWKIGHPLVFPNMVKIGGAGFQQFQIRVPIDNVTTRQYWYTVYVPPDGRVPPQDTVPSYEVPLKDANGRWILDFIDGQDIAAWAGQGVIADRSQETLGASDRGVVMYRRMLKEQLQAVADGRDPLGVVRDEAGNRCIVLPVEKSKSFAEDKRYIRGILTAQAVRYSPLNAQLKELFGVADAAVAA